MEHKKRLEAFEKMLQTVQENERQVAERLTALKAAGKVKSATCMQLMGHRAMLRDMLDLYRAHGLID